MDSPASDSENESYQTDDSEYNCIPGPHLIDEPTEVEEAVGSPNMVNMGAEEPPKKFSHIGTLIEYS